MTDDTTNLVLAQLRHIRSKVDQIADDMGIVKERLTNLEGRFSRVERGAAEFNGEFSVAHQRIDLVDKRLSRIEARLDPIDLAQG